MSMLFDIGSVLIPVVAIATQSSSSGVSSLIIWIRLERFFHFLADCLPVDRLLCLLLMLVFVSFSIVPPSSTSFSLSSSTAFLHSSTQPFICS